ncbi:MAG: hypothetical protein F2817_11710 [Actinobacteria bacterium]|nr:hypothetical protein [Actinomycetota bacterium]
MNAFLNHVRKFDSCRGHTNAWKSARRRAHLRGSCVIVRSLLHPSSRKGVIDAGPDDVAADRSSVARDGCAGPQDDDAAVGSHEALLEFEGRLPVSPGAEARVVLARTIVDLRDVGGRPAAEVITPSHAHDPPSMRGAARRR